MMLILTHWLIPSIITALLLYLAGTVQEDDLAEKPLREAVYALEIYRYSVCILAVWLVWAVFKLSIR